ncbi:MAG TPA: DUF1800 domain-containing protein [Methylovirgula sp.]
MRYRLCGIGLLLASFLMAGQGVAAPAYDAETFLLLDRLTFGATASEAARLKAMGADRWLNAELHPPTADNLPAQVQQEINALDMKPMNALIVDFAAKVKALKAISDSDLRVAAAHAYQQELNDCAKRAAARSILRDLYSPSQLREVMTWFWFNHFNVHQYKADIRAMVGDYEDTIRAHALGHFRDLLEATLRHPAMLRYLDNAQNAVGHINENYAREIMELHTLDVGSGYTQQDVEALAHILTGVGVDVAVNPPHVKPALQDQVVRDGLFVFNPARHDYGDQIFLGHKIKGAGFAEVEEALDILTRNPATARHISRELAIYFVADDPPDSLVEKMSKTFLRSNGDIAAVLRTMIDAPEFSASATKKFKDPVRYVMSAMRLAYEDKVILNTQPVQNWLNRLAEGLYNYQTPDGYPLVSSAWDGPGQIETRFEIARQIGSGSAGLFKPDMPGAADSPAFPQIENALYFDGLQQTLRPATRAALDEAQSPQDWNVLFLSSPDFMR